MMTHRRAAALRCTPAGTEQDVAQQEGAARSSSAAPAPAAAAAEPEPGAAGWAGGDFRFAVTFTCIAVTAFFRSLLAASSGSDAAKWSDHAALAGYAVCCASLACLAAVSATYRRPRVRHSVVAAFRLCAFLGADRAVHRDLMSLPPVAGPSGPLVDLVHLAMGTEAIKLFLFSTFLPLPLPAQLVVCTLTLVAPMRANPQSCGLALMNNPASVIRLAAFHELLSIGTMGMLHGFPGTGLVQCTAALAFVQLLLGWLLPTFLVARASWQAVQAREGSQSSDRRRQPDLDDRLACWLMDSVFLADAPRGLAVLAWGILLTLAWMAAGLIAMIK